MKTLKHALALLLFIAAYSNSFAQDIELLEELPKTKEEYIQSEKKVLASFDWLENSPLDQEEQKHKHQYALLTNWIINSPTVIITLNENVLTFLGKNKQLLMYFMIGWTRYSLANNYSNERFQANIAGVRCVIKIYKKRVGLEKDKEMEKLVKLEDKGKLENWMTEQLAKKQAPGETMH